MVSPNEFRNGMTIAGGRRAGAAIRAVPVRQGPFGQEEEPWRLLTTRSNRRQGADAPWMVHSSHAVEMRW